MGLLSFRKSNDENLRIAPDSVGENGDNKVLFCTNCYQKWEFQWKNAMSRENSVINPMAMSILEKNTIAKDISVIFHRITPGHFKSEQKKSGKR